MSRPRVLVVDDDVRALQVITDLIRDEFDVVGTASQGEGALAMAIDLQPDLIVLDFSMAGLNGLEVAGRLRTVNHPAGLVLLTCHEDVGLVRAARAAGVLGYVIKGLAASDLPLALRCARCGRPFASSPVAVDEEEPRGVREKLT